MELNPNHPVTRQMHDHWHKICALLMAKMGEDHVVITTDDLRELGGDKYIVVQELNDEIHLRFVEQAEAERLARQAGGLLV